MSEITKSIGVSYKRTNPVPLDSTSVFATKSAALQYAKEDPTAYDGQMIIAGGHAYIIHKTADGTRLSRVGESTEYEYSVAIDNSGSEKVYCLGIFSVIDTSIRIRVALTTKTIFKGEILIGCQNGILMTGGVVDTFRNIEPMLKLYTCEDSRVRYGYVCVYLVAPNWMKGSADITVVSPGDAPIEKYMGESLEGASDTDIEAHIENAVGAVGLTEHFLTLMEVADVNTYGKVKMWRNTDTLYIQT